MEPLNRYGFKPLSKSTIIFYLLCSIFLAYIIVIALVENSPYKTIILLIVSFALILFFLSISIICSNRKIFLFFNSYMLYRENLNFIELIKLILIYKKTEQIEYFLDRKNYISIASLEIQIKNIDKILTDEKGVETTFILTFNDQQSFTFCLEDTKEAYLQFLTPFINYHVNILDPYNLIDGLYQPLRLSEYLKQNL